MKKLLTLFLVTTLLFSSCNKEEEELARTCNNQGTIRVTNATGNDYDVYFNNDYQFNLKEGTYRETKVAPGGYNIYCEQTDYWVTPRTRTFNTNIQQCDSKTAVID